MNSKFVWENKEEILKFKVSILSIGFEAHLLKHTGYPKYKHIYKWNSM